MQAEIITIGDEILIGQIVDSNSAFIAQQLNKIGVSVYQITSVQDDTEHILKSLKEAEENADIIILTGGLGPTKDDITKNTIATYFQDTLVQDTSVLKNIETLWKNYIKQPLSQLNIDQALMPSKATALMNKVGSAPGMWLEKGAKTFISLPGVPFEMKALIDDEVIPRLRKKYKFPYILHKTLLTYGIGESNLAEKIETWEDNLPKHIKLAYLPNLGKVRLRLSAKGNVKEEITKEVEHQIHLLLPQIEEYFTGFEDQEESIEALIAKKLSHTNQTLATAESCTGGKIAASITRHSGASAYFKGSIVSYTKEIKINVLNVPETLIAKHSVVSPEVAEAMARNVLQIFKTDYAIATTGNAGPTKDKTEEEVGTVFIAIATKNAVFSQKFTFGKPREKVINRAVNKALELLKKEIFKK
ncbi:competence/damage-inducible protein A [Lacinutrix sp. C3R15]|uniref:competence/damage-inducible protein A n=1 Tax=Flavobacteriaceae TaxID=49546 RepID=UPI001C085984|nr:MULTISPECIES: competence/damage-inducible protein A [Flavobacteriaceae]MBU2939502.1 competence/damage-inducible protein A [Lacinutrix sp. C3R15]MDO6622817.1 competence/damage-inducible protein A [Oceanihabitans sp. 1_MG-2023]